MKNWHILPLYMTKYKKTSKIMWAFPGCTTAISNQFHNRFLQYPVSVDGQYDLQACDWVMIKKNWKWLKMSLLTEYISFNFIIKRLRIMISKVYCSFHCLLFSSFYFIEISLKLFELFKNIYLLHSEKKNWNQLKNWQITCL